MIVQWRLPINLDCKAIFASGLKETCMLAVFYVLMQKFPSILSLTLQEDGVDIVQGIQNILKSSASLEPLIKDLPNKWPTIKLVLSRIATEGTSKAYQGATLLHYDDEMSLIVRNRCWMIFRICLNQSSIAKHGQTQNCFVWFLLSWTLVVGLLLEFPLTVLM